MVEEADPKPSIPLSYSPSEPRLAPSPGQLSFSADAVPSVLLDGGATVEAVRGTSKLSCSPSAVNKPFEGRRCFEFILDGRDGGSAGGTGCLEAALEPPLDVDGRSGMVMPANCWICDLAVAFRSFRASSNSEGAPLPIVEGISSSFPFLSECLSLLSSSCERGFCCCCRGCSGTTLIIPLPGHEPPLGGAHINPLCLHAGSGGRSSS